ncbi:insulinase family protein [bacterium]|nr:insulinase family protein [bacterium]
MFSFLLASSAPLHAAQTQKTSLDDIYSPASPVAIWKTAEAGGISEYQVKNGLKVLLYPRAGEPDFTVSLTVFAGSRHESPREAGLAHLLTHVTFKATADRPDLKKLLNSHGAEFDGASGPDHTAYYVVLPASLENLAFALSLEADRMVNARFDASDVSAAVSEMFGEIEASEKNGPAFLEQAMTAAAYAGSPYENPVLGNRAALGGISITDVTAFYERHHRPDNALLTLAGQFDTGAALILIEKYFGPLRARPARPVKTEWPEPRAEREVVLKQSGAESLAAVLYRGVSGADGNFPAAQALVDLLTANPSGDLYRDLVKKGLATEVTGRVEPRAGPGAILFTAKVKPGKSPERVRDRMVQTIEKFSGGRISAGEVDRFRNRTLTEYDLALADGPRAAIGLSLWSAVGDWRDLFLHRGRIGQLTENKILEAAKKYLTPDRRTTGIVIPTR